MDKDLKHGLKMQSERLMQQLIPFENKSFVINFQMNERMIYNIRQASTSDYEGIEKQFYEKVKIFQQELVAVWKEDLVKNKISFSGI